MSNFLWNSSEEKEREWLFAKEKLTNMGELLPNGTKLRRKDHPNDLNHSFMIIDDQIIAVSGKGIYLGKGRNGRAKLAEDEAGHLFALKIITNDVEADSAKESDIAHDLGIAGRRVTRTGAWKGFSTKHYISYQYLGTRLLDYIRSNSLTLDKCYELCIKISLSLHDIHTGQNTKSKKSYRHNDIHWGNIVIDDKEEPHFIDFGRAWNAYGQNESDIVSMLLLFFTPKNDRNYRYEDWIFGQWLGEYNFSDNKPRSNKNQHYIGKNNTFYMFVESADRTEDGLYHKVHYMVKNSLGVFQQGILNLDDLQSVKLPYINEKDEEDESCWTLHLSCDELSLIQNKVLELAIQNNHINNPQTRNETLFNLLENPTALYRASEVPTALDIAEVLTLCRFRLESYQDLFVKLDTDARREIIYILNAVSMKTLALYEQLDKLSGKNNELDRVVKDYLVSNLRTPTKDTQGIPQFTKLGETEAQLLKQSLKGLIKDIIDARASWKLKLKPVLQEEPKQQPQSQQPDVIKPIPSLSESDLLVKQPSPSPNKKVEQNSPESKEIDLNTTGKIDSQLIDKNIISTPSQENWPNRDTVFVPKEKAPEITQLKNHPKAYDIEGETFSDKTPKIHDKKIEQNSLETVQTNQQQLEKILAAFENLKSKQVDLDKKATEATNTKDSLSYARAREALGKTIGWLNAPIAQYQSGTILIETLRKKIIEIFNTNDAKKEMKIINSHRGTKQFWAEFMGAIFTAGFSLIYKALKGYSLFKVNTDTANKLEEFKDSINNTTSIKK